MYSLLKRSIFIFPSLLICFLYNLAFSVLFHVKEACCTLSLSSFVSNISWIVLFYVRWTMIFSFLFSFLHDMSHYWLIVLLSFYLPPVSSKVDRWYSTSFFSIHLDLFSYYLIFLIFLSFPPVSRKVDKWYSAFFPLTLYSSCFLRGGTFFHPSSSVSCISLPSLSVCCFC